MLSLIVCSKYQHISPELERNIASTIGDCPYEIVWIDNSRGEYSIFQAYNIGVERAKYPYLCFMHEDIIYHSKDWGQKVVEHLKDKRVGFIGLVGSYFEDELSITWDRWSERNEYSCVNYIQSDDKGRRARGLVLPVEGSEGFVAVLDGFWMCCRADLFEQGLYWDEEYYDCFHQYDSDICMQAVKAGYWNKVIYDVTVEHQSFGNFNRAFYESVVRFHKKWDYMLPVVAPGYQMPDDYVETQRTILEIGRLRCLVDEYSSLTLKGMLKQQLADIKWRIKKSLLSMLYQAECRLKSMFSLHSPKVALCCIAKMENDYIREFVEHYRGLGFDNITIFDNNDIDGETFDEVIADYIESEFCRIIDYRGRKECHLEAYQEFYDRFGSQYDWIAYFDCDEFLTFTRPMTIQEFLLQKKFRNYQQIHINWLMYGDNDMLDNDGRPMQERFTKPVTPYQKLAQEPYLSNNHVKTITRGSLKSVNFINTHTCFTHYYRCCKVDGTPCDVESFWYQYDYSEAYLKHFSTRTIGEWIRIRQKRGLGDMPAEMHEKYLSLDMFFRQNKRTPEKEAYAQKLIEEMQ